MEHDGHLGRHQATSAADQQSECYTCQSAAQAALPRPPQHYHLHPPTTHSQGHMVGQNMEIHTQIHIKLYPVIRS